MPLVKYGVKVKKPENADDLSVSTKQHIAETKKLTHLSTVTGAQYGKAIVKHDPELRSN